MTILGTGLGIVYSTLIHIPYSRGLHTSKGIHLRDMHGISGHNFLLLGPKYDILRNVNKLAHVVVKVL